MAVNPMQRKARNSFLGGMFLTLLITGLIIAFLVIQLANVKGAETKLAENTKKVYVLKKNINAGTAISSSDVTEVSVGSESAPSNAIKSAIDADDKIAKIDLTVGTVISENMIYENEELTKDIRLNSYNMIVLPKELEVDTFVDIRLRLPSGQDYVVVSKKQIKDAGESTVSFNLSEAEILTMSCAIVESYQIQGSMLYALQYVEPGIQEAAVQTYPFNQQVWELVQKDPNIVAITSKGIEEQRTYLNMVLNQNSVTAAEDVKAKVLNEVTKMQEERKSYIESLGIVNTAL